MNERWTSSVASGASWWTWSPWRTTGPDVDTARRLPLDAALVALLPCGPVESPGSPAGPRGARQRKMAAVDEQAARARLRAALAKGGLAAHAEELMRAVE